MGGCDLHVDARLAQPSGFRLTLRTTEQVPCDALAVPRALVLTFRQAVDPASMTIDAR
ncbi:MAG TPA: hypothetical protein VNL94_03195 [Candidatus Binatia bacterium]|nr:hypothetical protein [Candidatus Binatia bacterium]